jgi:MFS family permease
MTSLGFLELLRHPRLSRLFAARWLGQTTDGIFQSALASFVLFSPERKANALSAALAFAVVLLPYSLIGPFVGTVLDRVSRQRAVLFSNLARSGSLLVIALLISQGHTGLELTFVVLIAFGLNRLILAALSAGLPLIINNDSLISANAMAVTGGSIFVVIGGGIGLGLRKIFDSLHNANHSDASLILVATIGYFITSLLILRLGKKEIGPLDHQKSSASFGHGIVEMREGFDFLSRHTDVARGIAATAIQRGGLNGLLIIAILLERNTFHSASKPEAGLSGLAVALTLAGVGLTIGALIAPFGVDKFGRHRWIRYMMLASGLSPLLLAITHTAVALFIAAFFTSLFGQSLKVTNDALVQSKIDDYFRGRVFAVYDVLVNGAIVSGAVIAAILLDPSGKSVLVPLLISGVYLLSATRMLRPAVFNFTL